MLVFLFCFAANKILLVDRWYSIHIDMKNKRTGLCYDENERGECKNELR